MKTRAAFWALYCFLFIWAALAGGCAQTGGAAVAPAIESMGGGSASGSGATLVPPPAAAEPSEQHAVEETYYAAPEAVPEPPAAPQAAPAADVPTVVFHAPGEEPAAVAAPPAVVPSPTPPPAPPRPIYRRSETFTRLGAQQEVAPMLKQVSGIFGRMNRAHWLGVLAIVVGLGGILHSAGNRESGYPVVWLKVLGGGVLAVVMGNALWFWILCGLAFLLYLGQKLGVIRVPSL